MTDFKPALNPNQITRDKNSNLIKSSAARIAAKSNHDLIFAHPWTGVWVMGGWGGSAGDPWGIPMVSPWCHRGVPWCHRGIYLLPMDHPCG